MKRFGAAAVLIFLACAFISGCSTAKPNVPGVFELKIPRPQPLAGAATLRPAPFEQQFRIDTGETNSTPRAEFDRSLQIKGQSKDQLKIHSDFDSWPEAMRKQARLWIGIGASASFTTEVNITLTFSQNGASVTTPLNNLISIDGVALMGCDFAAQDGDVTVEIKNEGMLRDVDYTLHVIAYVPTKPSP